jgi:hypothetical protein
MIFAMNKLQRRSAIAGLGLAVCALVACGGGGGEGHDGGDGLAQNPDVPTPSVGVNPGLSGWFAFRPAATNTVYRVDAATGASTLVATAASGQHSLSLSQDGTRYAQTINDSVTGQENSEFMKLQVYETATKTLLFELEFEGYANAFSFSPDNRFLAAIVYPDLQANATLSASGLAIIDLANLAAPVVVVDFMASGGNVVYDFDWLPDNRFVYLRADRTLVGGSALVPGGNLAVLGPLEVPANHFVSRDISASPDGKKILLTYNWADGRSARNDIWIANIDGSGAQRFSDGQHGEASAWSPDSQYVVVSTNAGAYFQAGLSNAYCERWYAPATARNVNEASAEARPVNYLENGKVAEVPCFSGFSYMRK